MSSTVPEVDVYCVPAGEGTFELKVKSSRFIADVFPVRSRDDAMDLIEGVRAREHAATHHCWAYRIGSDAVEFRFNDDGEPAGTAGAPILRQIDGLGLVDTLVVVTRYYGGTKLGTGGLIRAYGDAAGGVLDAVRVRRNVIRTHFELRFGYDDTSAAMQTISRFDTNVVESMYRDDTRLRVAVRRSQADEFETVFVDNLAGRGVISRI